MDLVLYEVLYVVVQAGAVLHERPSVRDGTAVQSQHCNAGEKATISPVV
jgi:hypothetical protein